MTGDPPLVTPLPLVLLPLPPKEATDSADGHEVQSAEGGFILERINPVKVFGGTPGPHT